MAITYRTDDGEKWGTGKGSNLTPAEVDLSFWHLAQELIALAESLSDPVGIANITQDGNALTITLDDETELGPFTLPGPTWSFRGDWTNSTSYFVNDLVRTLTGLFLVLQAHTSPAPPAAFNPAAVDGESNPLYLQVFGRPDPVRFVFGLNFLGLIPDDESPAFLHIATQNFRLPADLEGSAFRLAVPPLSGVTFSIVRNGSAIGSVAFAAAAVTGVITFASDVDFAPGDVLAILTPDTLDAEAESLFGSMVAQAL